MPLEFLRDPLRTITSADWQDLAFLVQLLWFLVILNVGVGFLMLLAHAVIPSMVATGHISRRLRSTRPILTLVALVLFAGTLFVLYNWVTYMATPYTIYPHRLI